MSAIDMDAWLWDQSLKASKEWNIAQTRDIFASLYLYHKRGELTVSRDAPTGFELSTGERLGQSGTTEQMMHKIYTIARRLPCLPE